MVERWRSPAGDPFPVIRALSWRFESAHPLHDFPLAWVHRVQDEQRESSLRSPLVPRQGAR
jgi:hypothetical protein